MSKSMNNAIGLLDPPVVLWEKLRTAVTDENRIRRSDPGNPDKCNVFTMHQAFSKPDQISSVDQNCRTAEIGCIECKQILFKNMMEEIGPIQERVKKMNEEPGYIIDVLKTGTRRCQAIVDVVMDEVKERIGVKSGWR